MDAPHGHDILLIPQYHLLNSMTYQIYWPVCQFSTCNNGSCSTILYKLAFLISDSSHDKCAVGFWGSFSPFKCVKLQNKLACFKFTRLFKQQTQSYSSLVSVAWLMKECLNLHSALLPKISRARHPTLCCLRPWLPLISFYLIRRFFHSLQI